MCNKGDGADVAGVQDMEEEVSIDHPVGWI